MNRVAVSIFLAGVFAGLHPAAAQNGMPMQHMQQVAPSPGSRAEDARELVQLPPPMQEHMLGNMRDHLATLNGIVGTLAEGKFDEAAKLSEQRLGMSSLGFHDAVHLAPFMPKPMQDFGTDMHRAASRLSIVLQNTAVTPTFESMREVNRALYEVTTACAGCHASYRIR
jgi:hypothetical protein